MKYSNVRSQSTTNQYTGIREGFNGARTAYTFLYNWYKNRQTKAV